MMHAEAFIDPMTSLSQRLSFAIVLNRPPL
jgi:hypothetical protein